MGKEWDKLDNSKNADRWAGKRTLTGKPKRDERYPGGRCSAKIATQTPNPRCRKCGHYQYSGTPCQCKEPEWEARENSQAMRMQLWHTQWLTEAYRVLKPGGSMLVMGGTRTFHRLMVAIEDTGFIIKDTLMWIYGSGFPKAQDLGKMIDKKARRQYVSVAIELGLFVPENSKWDWTKGEHGISDKWWEKFKSFLSPEDWQKIEREIIGSGTSGKTAIWNEKGEMGDFDITTPSTDLAKHWDGFKVGGIKPAYEPIVWAVKPPEGSYIDNVLKWGVGAVNVDECRVGVDKRIPASPRKSQDRIYGKYNEQNRNMDGFNPNKGRFPANVILSHHPECERIGVKRVKCGNSNLGVIHGTGKGVTYLTKKESSKHHADPNGYETVESWDCHPDCAIRVMDEQSGENIGKGYKPRSKTRTATQFDPSMGWNQHSMNPNNAEAPDDYGDSGGASRFFYCAKASRSERGEDNTHPTVKPIKLFEYLIKLVTRKGQTVLDPFLGSGTTAIAAIKTGRKYIGIEREDDYVEIAKRRIEHWESQPQQQELRA